MATNPLVLIILLLLVFNLLNGGNTPFLLSALMQNPLLGIFMIGGIIIGISIHEFAHALVAYRLGDPTAKLAGRLTLNPASHLDPLGTFSLLFIGFGWGKPTPFDPYNLRNIKRDSALISVAGAASNFILAFILAAPYLIAHALDMPSSSINLIYLYIYPVIFFNVILGVFNLIPIAPLDGFKVLAGLLPKDWYQDFMQTEQYGIFILLFLLLSGVIGRILLPIVSVLLNIFLPGYQAPF